jgi:hypothetical protein
MSSEIPIEPISKDKFKPEIIREKKRSSYLVYNNAVRVDITLVNMVKSLKKEDDVTYEVEIELINKSKLIEFQKALIITLKLILDTNVLYTLSLNNKVINEVNSILGSSRKDTIDHTNMVQARNLKLRDMVYGGLIGNKNTGYSITHKADGIRKLLVFLDSGIWLISAPSSLTRISDKPIPTLTGTILDGESIPLNKRLNGAPSAKYWYLSFDALAWNRDKSIQNEPHGKRMFYAQSVSDIIKGDILTINTKSFKNISTPQEFFKIMREMFREQLLLTYQQDGFMFTPQNVQYNPHSDTNPLYRRILTIYPDICKWKSKDELTIDFLIKWKVDPSSQIQRNLEIYSNERGVPKKFTKAEVDILDPLTLNLPITQLLNMHLIMKKIY